MPEATHDVQPIAIDRLDEFDYDTRVHALRLAGSKLTGPPHWFQADLNDVMVSTNFRTVVECLAAMAASAFLEYYGQWDAESAETTILREIRAAEELDQLHGEPT